MTARRPWKAFVAPRTTVALLLLLALMLLLNVMLPQRSVLGPEAFADLLTGRPTARFFLVTLGLGQLATSPLFLGVLVLFFLNLAAVIATRVGPTLRRTRMRERSEKGLAAWARMEESLSAPLPGDWGPAAVVETLRGFGYRVRRAGERTFWGVKHRSAPLGFLLFHLSFFLLCAGGVAIYLTRFVGTAVVTEGQALGGDYQQVLRHPPWGPPWGGPPRVRFTLDEVDPRFEAGEPVHLGATLLFDPGAGAPVARTARVNDPARWGATSVLIQAAGISPVLWLQDPAGFTLDRVAVSARTRSVGTGLGGTDTGEGTEAPLLGGRLVVRIEPLPPEVPFPGRRELSTTPVRLTVLETSAGTDEDPAVLFSGALRPGEAAPLALGSGSGQPGGGPVVGRLVLEELRYWAGLQVVRERGGGLLIAGFVCGVLGLVWRLLLHRREVVVSRDDDSVYLVGRSEYFSGRFHGELRALFAELAERARDGRNG